MPDIVIDSPAKLTTITPMMKQYLDVKSQYEGYILMYRLGDFYEMFFQDAIVAAHDIELTLTARDAGDGLRAAMCGIPFHHVDEYVGKLVEKGHKVAICEQMEDPATATGIVKREVIRVITPGTVTDHEILKENQNNYLSAIYLESAGVGLAFCDISTGAISVTYIDGQDILPRVKAELSVYEPSEAILNVKLETCPEISSYLKDTYNTLFNDNEERRFSETPDMRLEEIYGDECRKFTCDAERKCVKALLSYVEETQKCGASFVRELQVYSKGQYMDIDLSTRRNLELCETMRQKEKKGSLLWVLDKTKTSMGARMLRQWISKPLLSPVLIDKRLGAVEEFSKKFEERDAVREELSHIYDIERLTAKAVYGTANAKDLHAICESLSHIPEIVRVSSACQADRITTILTTMDPLQDLYELLSMSIVDNPPFSIREGGMIRDGYNADVDMLRSVKNNADEWLHEIEEREKNKTGIRTLRVSYNKVFGFFIEVSKSFIDQVPPEYIRKQTLTNCERYITQELKELETTILGASDKLSALEGELFAKIRAQVAAASARIQETAGYLSEIDIYQSLAEVAVKNQYVRPVIDNSDVIKIVDGRHPVVEKFMQGQYFVPNDTYLDERDQRLMLITGPNMAGKSTYMRQVAIITILAQIGSFVPAKEAHIGIVDKVFTRVGASDDLAAGQSTFMLEMSEVANILKSATKQSLIIYDEVGRGTSTYDGMSIARAVAEYTAGKKLGAKTLFATHYHEMTVLESLLPGIVNYHVVAKKRGENITFLRKIVKGATDDSYGIEVAKLAGVPQEVIRRAKEILTEIENETPSSRPVLSYVEKEDTEDLFMSIKENEEKKVVERIRNLDLNTVTPIEAISLLYECQQSLKDKGM